MTEPDREPPQRCPVCKARLRPFGQRLCCDRCEGIFLAVADFARSIDELTRIEPLVAFTHERAGARPCPTCGAAMTRCRVQLQMIDKRLEPKAELDRCDAHGLWFDTDELADIYVVVEREFGAHGGAPALAELTDDGRTPPMGPAGRFKLPS